MEFEMKYSGINFGENCVKFRFLDQSTNSNLSIEILKSDNIFRYLNGVCKFTGNIGNKQYDFQIMPVYLNDTILSYNVENSKKDIELYADAILQIININFYKYIAHYFATSDKGEFKQQLTKTIENNMTNIFSNGVNSALESQSNFIKEFQKLVLKYR